MDSLIPFPLGMEMKSSPGFPRTKTLSRRVAKLCPVLSLISTMSNDPECLLRCMKVPTRPELPPPVTIQVRPGSNLMNCLIFPEAISTMTVSWTLMSGSGYLIVLASWVTRNGTPFLPVPTFFTLQSLYCQENYFLVLCIFYVGQFVNHIF